MRNTFFFFFIVLLVNLKVAHAQSSSSNQKQDNGIKEINDANKTITNANSSIEQTNESLKSTINSSKETINTIGSLFGTGDKKKTPKGTVNITIHNATYDNESIHSLYNHIIKTRGVKKPVKKYNSGLVSILLNYKESADNLWQMVPKSTRNSFKMIEISDNTIVVKYSK
ncbi:hypothetical protein CLV91_3348 [Maribacter vaceletii]|uniref:Uncharacterized protein n=1 Tax=Maribacter vaceletii TaxID=1206816 RepID=A0A495DS30_9FLAO|nr:hypothetical protein [Maribacter vaceletii]RKR06493.1 hypothetical protein CLV91_3348 [Maribacter vaceletii]